MTLLAVKTVDQIQANLIAYFRLFAGLPGITFVEEDITWITTAAGAPGNHIVRTKVAADKVEQRLDETIRRIGKVASQVDWYVFPGCQPADLGERVAERGLVGGPDGAWQLINQIGGPGGNWLVADLTALPAAPPVAAPFHIKPVGNDQQLEEWRQASSAGFGGGECHELYAAYARHGYGADAFSLRYIGYLADQPVTSGTLLLADGIAGLFDISTPPAFRRQGFGSAISWAMMQEARARGYQQAYVWSSSLGKGVYAGVGFVPVELGMREYQWQKRENNEAH